MLYVKKQATNFYTKGREESTKEVKQHVQCGVNMGAILETMLFSVSFYSLGWSLLCLPKRKMFTLKLERIHMVYPDARQSPTAVKLQVYNLSNLKYLPKAQNTRTLLG